MSKRPKIKMPTDDEDAAINAGIAADPDAREITSLKGAKRGRPKLSKPKQSVTLRVDPDVIEAYKAEGKGWQTRMQAALRIGSGLGTHVVKPDAKGGWTVVKQASAKKKSANKTTTISQAKARGASALSRKTTKKSSSSSKRA